MSYLEKGSDFQGRWAKLFPFDKMFICRLYFNKNPQGNINLYVKLFIMNEKI